MFVLAILPILTDHGFACIIISIISIVICGRLQDIRENEGVDEDDPLNSALLAEKESFKRLSG